MNRLTIRARLTLLWGGLFLVAGAILLSLTYLLLRQNLTPDSQVAEILGGREPIASSVMVAAEAAGRVDSNCPQDSAGSAADSTTNQGVCVEMTVPVTTVVSRAQQGALDTLITTGSIALGVVAVIGVGFGWLMADRALRPLATITATAQRVADRNLHERISLSGPHDEIKKLADTFDSMLERLDRAFDGQQRFVGNASHELRTPLAINRTLLEVALGRPNVSPELRQLGETLLSVNLRQEKLIDGLLTLARSDQTLTAHDPVNLADVATHVLELAKADAAGIALLPTLDSAITSGDQVLLERLVENLVENARRYNAPGGWVAITTRTVGEKAEITVSNTGPVVAAYEVPGLFEPFRRLRDRVGSANGTGLGLSIVRSVAHAHGGTVAALPRQGGGLVVYVTLPAKKN